MPSDVDDSSVLLPSAVTVQSEAESGVGSHTFPGRTIGGVGA